MERLACWNDVHQLTEYKAKSIKLSINFVQLQHNHSRQLLCHTQRMEASV